MTVDGARSGKDAPKGAGPPDPSKAYSLVPMPAQLFDKYTLIGKLGHGGMAEVNLAVVGGRGGFRKLTVIKRLHRHLAMEPGFIDMFLDEARLAARLNHPHCVQTHEVGDHNGNYFLAMEYLDGQGLERLLRMSGQVDELVPWDVAARIVSDALDGLAYAHELTDFDGTDLGVVHRDISPQNIFVTYPGMVKLLDFGIAKAATHVVETRTGVIKGKYAYIAPEQALGQSLDHRADLWSMGVVLWEVLTGRRLFKSVNELATLHETLQGEIKLPSAFRDELPTELDTICMRALQREPDDRYQTAQEMKEDLDRYLLSLPHTPGRKQIAQLMRKRFKQVIQAHKTTIAQCLEGSGSKVTTSLVQKMMDGGAISSPAVLTPSNISGMVHVPGGHPTPTPPPASHAPPPHSVTPTPTPAPHSVTPTPTPAPYSGTPSRPGLASPGLADPGPVGGPSNPAVSTPAPHPPHGSPSLTPPPGYVEQPSRADSAAGGLFWKVGLVAVVILLSVIAALLIPFGNSDGTEPVATTDELPDDDPVQVVGSQPETQPETQPADPPPVVAEPIREDPPGEPAAEEPAAEEPAAEEPTTEGDPEAARRAEARRLARARAREERRRAAEAEREASSETLPQEGASSATATGTLSLATTPWTHVTVGGRDLGTTPLIRVSLPAGTHRLHLTNPEQGIDETYSITIPPNGNVSRRLGLR